jgi:hypothetical protein
MSEMIIRFLAGGILVSVFATLSDMVKPKSFAGLFGAAPSVALASLSLTLLKKSPGYAAIECRSMLFGACGLLCYCFVVSRLLKQARMRALQSSLLSLPIWFGISIVLWCSFAR